ncbi:large conductance mechanosensitive channel protein MscL [Croceicoccus mobilis]|uniref:Large-conductance mechanosensitive channel n=1 Tax=Croceicoccus mobilis TaxID=1703339 RepID=A0A916Z5V0_9SPHN|nr:large conductance mechanosensitive channel protein MscL [Croceicoccus mobilis]GGD77887.1 large-conductance mechanosensitive channel [Croceicoccus mobilis]
MFKEFKKFIARGNVLDLAVGVIIGAAFGKITTSLTQSIIMPLLGWIFGTMDWSNHFILLGEIPEGYEGDITNYAALKEAGVPMIGYGDLVTQIINFLLIAFALFLIVRSANKVIEEVEEQMKEAPATSEEPAVPTDPTLDVLKEIRDELKAAKSAPPAA